MRNDSAEGGRAKVLEQLTKVNWLSSNDCQVREAISAMAIRLVVLEQTDYEAATLNMFAVHDRCDPTTLGAEADLDDVEFKDIPPKDFRSTVEARSGSFGEGKPVKIGTVQEPLEADVYLEARSVGDSLSRIAISHFVRDHPDFAEVFYLLFAVHEFCDSSSIWVIDELGEEFLDNPRQELRNRAEAESGRLGEGKPVKLATLRNPIEADIYLIRDAQPDREPLRSALASLHQER